MNDMDISYIKFRYTFLSNANVLQVSSELQSLLYSKIDMFRVLGIERLDKLGEVTHTHLHIHFMTTEKHSAIVKRLQRYFKENDEQRKGNVLYSCKLLESVDDVNRFLRYPLKQCKFFNSEVEVRYCKERSKFPDDFDYDLQCELASEEYDRMVKFNVKKRDDALLPNTKDKLFEYLDGVHDLKPFQSKLQILESILIYYNQEEKSANQSTIMGYLNTALMRYSLMSPLEMAKKWLE